MNESNKPQIVIAKTEKSVGISLILTILFGPLGLLYSSVFGGMIMILLGLLVAVFTLGFGLIIIWPICIVWGAISASLYNRKLRAMAG